MSNWDVTAPGRQLHTRFLALGNMTGMTADEIIASVGPPSSVSSMASGQTLMQWQEAGCHMALLFDTNGQFVKITHQYAKYAPYIPPPPPPDTGCLSILAVLLVFLATVVAASIRVFR
jgi:hypothetical protein